MNARGFVASALLTLTILTPGAARAATHDVGVGPGNAFTPQQLQIAIGDSVTWTVNEDGHTITADDGSFDREGMLTGQSFTHGPFTEDETFYYRCKVHAEMFGVITVGEGTPIPDPNAGPSEIRRVCRGTCDPGEYPTVGQAMMGVLPRALIELEPGTYTESIVLAVPGLVVRGAGPTPADVVIDAERLRLYGVQLFGDQTAVEHLTVRRSGLYGVYVSDADGFGVSGVIAESNGAAGVYVERARGGFVRDSVARGHALAGFAAANCPACDTVFTGVVAEDNFIGLDADDAGSVVVKDSTFTGNGTGIALRTTWVRGDTLDEDAPQRGAHIWGNTIEANTALDTPAPAISASAPLRTGSGIWINAGSFNVVESNTITGHLYGVVVTGLVGPSARNRIVGNTIGSSSAADIAWDGIGIDTCLGDNESTGGELTTAPPAAATIYDCALPATVGIPFPPVDITLLDYATI